MIVCSVNRYHRGYPKTVGWLLLSFTLLKLNISAQQKDTLLLKEVIISTAKAEKLTAGKKIHKSDSLTLSIFSNTTVSELLAITSPVFVKSYGPANLATSSFRGGNASQTAVLWNGFNIQNPMLGQNDFAQLPNFIFDDVAVEYGGSGALWGSGAVGGSIHLNNNAKFGKGFSTLLNVGSGSYNSKKLNTRIHYSSGKISTTTKVYLNNATNNFTYLDTVEKNQTHSNYEINGFLQELGFLLGNHKITTRAWYNNSRRNFPPPLGNKISRALQDDKNLKLCADYIYNGKKFVPGLRFAYFNDALNYTDSISKIFSNSTTRTIISESDLYYKINENHNLYAGINFTNYKATTENYLANHAELSKTAFLFGYGVNTLEKKLTFDLTLRRELSPSYTIPLTGNCGITYRLLKQFKLKASAARVYRLPTLNDLYWSNGGNPNLKPEDGYTYDGTLELKLPFNVFVLQSEMSYFNKHIQNWIGWIPSGNGNSMPINILKVYSRGTETSSSLTYTEKNLLCKIGFNSAYVLSTSTESALLNDASVNKQLIYTPRYNFGGSFTCVFHDFSFVFYHNYTGYRFTSSDNTSWLKPYHLANVKLAYSFKMPEMKFSLAFHVNNVYGTSYQVVSQYAMPLRNYELSVTLNYNKQKKNKTKTDQP